MCLRRRKEETLSDLVGVRKRTGQERLLSMSEYDLTARRTRAEKSTELKEELKNQMDEERVKLEGDSKDDELCAWMKKPIEDIAYSG